MAKKLTAISLFSGCGGFDWGVQQAGVEIIWANDIYPHAAAAYRSIFPDVEFVQDDIQNIACFPKAEILIGCYPCTGFSVGARRRYRPAGAEKSRERILSDNDTNFLYWQFLRVLEQVRPRFAFIENVGGMTSAEQGYFLEDQLFHFRRLHYDAKIARLRATDYGSAQMRERVFIVLTSYDMRPFEYEFPEPTHGPGRTHEAKVLRDIIWGMDEWPVGEFGTDDFHGHYLTRNRKRGWHEQSYTIVANEDHVPLHPIGEPMRKVGKDAWELQGDRNRRLSWVECARIQDLPDNIYPTGNLEHKYRVIGNAVPPVFGRALLSPIVAANPAPRVIRI
jgi:DNA (cytosine-5)-methyltransferase 1